jgi:hypothetical protein
MSLYSSRATALKTLQGNVLMLGFVSFFTDLSSEMIYPLLPVFFTGLVGVNAAAVYVGLMDGIAESYRGARSATPVRASLRRPHGAKKRHSESGGGLLRSGSAGKQTGRLPDSGQVVCRFAGAWGQVSARFTR